MRRDIYYRPKLGAGRRSGESPAALGAGYGFRRSSLDWGSSTTKPGHAVPNPRIRDGSTVVASPASCLGRQFRMLFEDRYRRSRRLTPAGLEDGHERADRDQVESRKRSTSSESARKTKLERFHVSGNRSSLSSAGSPRTRPRKSGRPAGREGRGHPSNPPVDQMGIGIW